MTRLAITTCLKNGRIKGRPCRYIAGHQNRKRIRHVEKDCDYSTPCWISQLAKNNRGYAVVGRTGGKKQLAHRVAYEEHNGPIPEGLVIDHLCRTRACVRPSHMEATTHIENVRRGRNAKLTRREAQDIKGSQESPRTLAQRHGITQSHVSRIRSGQAWRDLADDPS